MNFSIFSKKRVVENFFPPQSDPRSLPFQCAHNYIKYALKKNSVRWGLEIQGFSRNFEFMVRVKTDQSEKPIKHLSVFTVTGRLFIQHSQFSSLRILFRTYFYSLNLARIVLTSTVTNNTLEVRYLKSAFIPWCLEFVLLLFLMPYYLVFASGEFFVPQLSVTTSFPIQLKNT